MEKIIYTVLLGDYQLFEPECKNKDWKLICFSDRERKSKHWNVRIIDKFKSPLIKSREIKIKYFDFFDCDLCFYIDSKFKIRINLDNFINNNMTKDMLLMNHNRRDCAYDEINYCIGKKGKEKALRSQLQFFKKESFPRHFGLYAPGIMIRKNTEDVRNCMMFWYEQIKKFGYRDMASLAYTLWKYPVKCNIINFKQTYGLFK